MNYTKLFYWITVADNAKALFTSLIVIFTAVTVIATIINFICRGQSMDDGDSDKSNASNAKTANEARKWIKWAAQFAVIFWMLQIFTPNKKDALLIVAGGQTLNYLSKDSTAKTIPHEFINFVVTNLQDFAQSAKVDLNIKDQKNKILEDAKNMTATEVLEKMKVDTAFAKIVLGK